MTRLLPECLACFSRADKPIIPGFRFQRLVGQHRTRSTGKALKTYVTNEKENTRTPFLRGILTRSLLDAGMPFKDAFRLASAVRDAFSEQQEISSDEIHERVSELLKEVASAEIREAYSQPEALPALIMVKDTEGGLSSFSRERLEKSLQSSGLKLQRSEQLTIEIHEALLNGPATEISSDVLGHLVYRCLLQESSVKAAKRYLVWSAFQRTDRPLILLIGGTVGTGKSTIATDLAYLLDIVRIQSTDMLREVMRMMIPNRLMQVLHESSFNAWKSLPIAEDEWRDRDQLVAEGYRSQAELLSVPCEAVLNRALTEGVSIILEGIHVTPELQDRLVDIGDAVIVNLTLAVLKPKQLKKRLRGRGSEAPRRRAQRYLENFDPIWSLQSYLLSEADRHDGSIIANRDLQNSIREITRHIIYELSRQVEATPETVFGFGFPIAEANHNEPWRDMVSCL